MNTVAEYFTVKNGNPESTAVALCNLQCACRMNLHVLYQSRDEERLTDSVCNEDVTVSVKQELNFKTFPILNSGFRG
jgi:hypothetical protein